MARSRSAAAMAGMAVAWVLLVAMAALVQPASAQCGNVNSLMGCLSAAKTGSQPTAACCSAMTAFAQYGTPAGEACLCQAISNPAAKAAGAQLQYAILIPQKCNLNYKAGYVCNGITSTSSTLVNFHSSCMALHGLQFQTLISSYFFH